MKHTCHAKHCTAGCPRRHLMCRRHWAMVPKDLQRVVWQTYQFGQEAGLVRPSKEYLAAAKAAIAAVADVEGQRAKESVAQRELFG